MFKRVLLWSSPFLLGLGIAFCGAQLLAFGDDGSTSSPASVSGDAPRSDAADPATPIAEGSDDVESAVTIAPEADPDDPLSPLATQVRPIGSAFPAEVLEGLGEAIGVEPLRISIGSVDVEDAPIEPVGIEDSGDLEVPGAKAVGWYRFGAGVDGGRGSTVLAAHIAYNGVDGVFRDLADVEVGDEVAVDAGGAELRYVVTAVDQYSKTTLPIADLFAEDGPERLVLITCGGSFNPSLRSYDDNVVVVAEPI